MFELLLFAHISLGIAAIAAALHKLVPVLSKLKRFFWPAVAGVSTSGVGLMLTGVSIARVCMSGIIMTAVLVIVHQLTMRKVVTEGVVPK